MLQGAAVAAPVIRCARKPALRANADVLQAEAGPSKTCQAGDTRVATGMGTVAGIGRARGRADLVAGPAVCMTSGTNCADALAATLDAAADLPGRGAAAQNAAAAAWSEVGRP